MNHVLEEEDAEQKGDGEQKEDDEGEVDGSRDKEEVVVAEARPRVGDLRRNEWAGSFLRRS